MVRIKDYFTYKEIALIEDALEFELINYLPGQEKSPRAKKLKSLVKKIEVILNEKESGIPPKR